MPQIDVTDILADPFIAGETFTVIRRLEVVDPYGQSQVTTQSFAAFGSITPAGDNSLVREEAFQTQAKSITVTTTFQLRGPAKDGFGNTYQPDLVAWKGDNFIVRSVSDFSQYGAGMVQADCTSIDLVDQPPSHTTAAPIDLDFTNSRLSDQIPALDGDD
jgi:hypothetical protein